MKIRVGAHDEREACVELWLGALKARDGREQNHIVAERAWAKFDQPLVRFAVAGVDPIGFALTTDSGGDSEGRVAVLELLAVRPSETGRGIGRMLVEDSIRSAAELGFSGVELHVRAGNAPAERLYRASGFKPKGEPFPHPLGGQPMIAYRLGLGSRSEADCGNAPSGIHLHSRVRKTK